MGRNNNKYLTILMLLLILVGGIFAYTKFDAMKKENTSTEKEDVKGGEIVNCAAISPRVDTVLEKANIARKWYLIDDTILYNGPTNSTDMTFSLRENQAPGYFHFDYQLMPSGVPFKETDPEGLRGLSDAHLIVTYSFERAEPEAQVQNLHAGILHWDNFRDSVHNEKLPYDEELLKSKDYSLSNLKMLDLAKNIYPGKE